MTTAFSRSRWAAFGAAIAVTLGAGGIGIANATLGSGERTSFVPINRAASPILAPGSTTSGPSPGHSEVTRA